MAQFENQSEAVGQYLSGRFGDIDEFAAAVGGWDLNFRQLTTGSLDAALDAVAQPQAFVTHCDFNQRFQQFGSTPTGMRTLGLLGRGVRGVHWCGREVSDATLLSFHPTSGFEAVSQTDFSCYTLSISEGRLEMLSEALGFAGVDDLLTRYETAYQRGGDILTGVRRRLDRMFDALRSNPALVFTPALRDEVEREVPAMLLSTVDSAAGEVARPSMRSRRRAVEKAIDVIDERAETTLTIEELCRAVGVSWRTLDYAFKEHFQVSPKKYLMAVRLNAVRRELRATEQGTTVANVASRWGFWHMGQFAKEYRKLFGESPSDTLRRRCARPLRKVTTRQSRGRGRQGN